MRTKIIYSLSLFSLLWLVGCQMEIADAPQLEVSPVISDSISRINDTIVSYVNHPITYNFVGKPDNITFYSGETGYKYKNHLRNTVSIEKVSLGLEIYTNYGPNPPSLRGVTTRLYCTKNFAGITNDFLTDSTNIRLANWNELRDKDPATGNPRSIDPLTRSNIYYTRGPYNLDTLSGDFNIAISLKYPALPAVTGTPIWNIRNMLIKGVEQGTTNEVIISTADFGFAPLNLLNSIYAPFYSSSVLYGSKPGINDPYKTFNPYSSYTGALMPSSYQLWDLRSIGAAIPSISFSGGDSDPARLNGFENWLISKSLNFNKIKCLPDYGVAIKDITKSVESYQYSYTKAGIYDVTFVANSTNKVGGNARIRHFVVKVINN